MRRLLIVGLWMILGILAACSPPATPEETPEPQPLLETAIDNIRSAESFAMTVEQGGTPFPFIFQTGSDETPFRTVMQRAQAHFVAPDVLQASARMLVSGAPINLKLFVDGFDQWVKPPLLNWRQYEYAPGFNPRLLLGEDSGFERALSRLNSLEYIGREDMFGTQVDHVQSEASGDVVNDLLFGLLIINNDRAIVDVFIDTATRFPVQILLTLPETATEDAENTFWRIELFDINDEQEFEAPPEYDPSATAVPVETEEATETPASSEATESADA